MGGNVVAAASLEAGTVELKRLLESRAMLLILDDVWNAAAAQPLQVGGPRCTTLLTTRDKTQAVGAVVVPLEVMQLEEGRALLRRAARGKLDDVALADRIAARLEYLPLALEIVGAMLEEGTSWSDVQTALDDRELNFLEYEQQSMLATIDASVSMLPADERARYHELTIFLHDEPLVEAVVARLWEQTANLKAHQSRRLLARLRSRSLVQAGNTLHALQYDYLCAVAQADMLCRWHSALADAYAGLTIPSSLSDDGNYGWRRLAYHLAQAQRLDDLRQLLRDGAYLHGKIERLGTAALLADFALLFGDPTIERIASALRLGAHILDRAPYELGNQLIGRLGSLLNLHNLPTNPAPFFRLLSQTLMSPAASLFVRYRLILRP